MSLHPDAKLRFVGTLLMLSLSGGCTPPARFAHEFGVVAVDSEAEVPRGMRRTVNGWEDASNWHFADAIPERPIDHWIERQQTREPGWIRRLFAKIRRTPPLMIAVVQITAVAAIIHISRSRVDPRRTI